MTLTPTPNSAGFAADLKEIVASLQSAPALKKTKLLFAITSPEICNKPIDDIQRALNAQVRRRTAPSWPPKKRWAGFSLFWLYSHGDAQANLHLLGRPDTFLGQAVAIMAEAKIPTVDLYAAIMRTNPH
jgi:hypothetical protein